MSGGGGAGGFGISMPCCESGQASDKFLQILQETVMTREECNIEFDKSSAIRGDCNYVSVQESSTDEVQLDGLFTVSELIEIVSILEKLE